VSDTADAVIGVAEAGRILGRSPGAVRGLVARGRLAALEPRAPGAPLTFDRAAVESWRPPPAGIAHARAALAARRASSPAPRARRRQASLPRVGDKILSPGAGPPSAERAAAIAAALASYQHEHEALVRQRRRTADALERWRGLLTGRIKVLPTSGPESALEAVEEVAA
jgi:hypothetical protein